MLESLHHTSDIDYEDPCVIPPHHGANINLNLGLGP